MNIFIIKYVLQQTCSRTRKTDFSCRHPAIKPVENNLFSNINKKKYIKQLKQDIYKLHLNLWKINNDIQRLLKIKMNRNNELIKTLKQKISLEYLDITAGRGKASQSRDLSKKNTDKQIIDWISKRIKLLLKQDDLNLHWECFVCKKKIHKVELELTKDKVCYKKITKHIFHHLKNKHKNVILTLRNNILT